MGAPSDIPKTVRPDEGPVLTVAEMGAALSQVSKPAEQEDPLLPFDPDVYPLF